MTVLTDAVPLSPEACAAHGAIGGGPRASAWAGAWPAAFDAVVAPQGGSALTQQLVRGCFLQDLTSRPDGDAVFHDGIGSVPPLWPECRATNKLLRKLGTS